MMQRSDAFQHAGILLVVCLLIAWPLLKVGVPNGMDADTHVQYQYHFSKQFWNGDYYPHWLAEANKGYGDPIFLIQYPLPYYATAALRTLHFAPNEFREAREIGLFCFLTLWAAGLAARFWFRQRSAAWVSTLAAIVYITMPYMLGQGVYVRTATGELLCFVWMPLMLAICDTRNKYLFPWFAILWALLLTSNLLCALLFLPLLIAYATASRIKLVTVGAMLALGTGMAAIYLIPAIAYRKLFSLATLNHSLPGFELGRYFLMTATSGHSRGVTFSLALVFLLSIVAVFRLGKYRRADVKITGIMIVGLGCVAGIPSVSRFLVSHAGLGVTGFDTPNEFSSSMLIAGLGTIALGVVSYCELKISSSRDWVLIMAAFVSFLLMLPVTAPLWQILTAFQFPFRLATILTLAVAGLVAVALDQAKGNERRVIVGLWVVIALSGALTWGLTRRILHPQTVRVDLSTEVDKMYRTYVPAGGLFKFAQEIGADVSSYKVSGAIPVTPLHVEGDCSASVLRQTPERLQISASCPRRGDLRVSQIYSPLWTVSEPAVESAASDGLISLRLPIGDHVIDARFSPGKPWCWGKWITMLSSLALASSWVLLMLDKI